jgi:hypothetical protein
MPINTGYDEKEKKHFIRWGNQKKYYYTNSNSFKLAKLKALQQMKAIYSSGYR